MGLASVNLMQLTLTAAMLCEMTHNDGHYAVHCHLRLLILVPIESPYATAY